MIRHIKGGQPCFNPTILGEYSKIDGRIAGHCSQTIHGLRRSSDIYVLVMAASELPETIDHSRDLKRPRNCCHFWSEHDCNVQLFLYANFFHRLLGASEFKGNYEYMQLMCILVETFY